MRIQSLVIADISSYSTCDCDPIIRALSNLQLHAQCMCTLWVLLLSGNILASSASAHLILAKQNFAFKNNFIHYHKLAVLEHYRTKIAVWLDKRRRIGWQYGAVRLAYIG